MQTITVIETPVPADAREHVIMDNLTGTLTSIFEAAREFQAISAEVAYDADAETVHHVYITEGQLEGYAIKALVSGRNEDAEQVHEFARWSAIYGTD